jgi:hypothetical protein
LKLISHILAIIFLLLLNSCITTSDLIKQKQIEPAKFSLSDFNGDYLNDCDTSEHGINLWSLLLDCKTFKNDDSKLHRGAIVNLNFSKNLLVATVSENGEIRNEIELKAKLKGDYISIKRNLHLIPIPFIWYRHQEAKAVLSKTKDGKLMINYFRSQFAWTLMAGSVEQQFNQTHKKVN